MALRATAVCVLAVAALAGCGSGSGNESSSTTGSRDCSQYGSIPSARTTKAPWPAPENPMGLTCQAGLVPGVLMRNEKLKFVCGDVHLKVETSQSLFTNRYQAGQVIRVPVAHAEGNYFADSDTLKRLEDRGQIAFRYCAPDGTVDGSGNPNGSIENIAGVFNDAKTVMGLMPHPENAVEPLFGGCDGKALFEGLVEALS